MFHGSFVAHLIEDRVENRQSQEPDEVEYNVKTKSSDSICICKFGLINSVGHNNTRKEEDKSLSAEGDVTPNSLNRTDRLDVEAGLAVVRSVKA